MTSIPSNVRVCVTRSEDEWIEVRECLVRAFYNYPLYNYLLPNQSVRQEFIRKYIEANYDAAVRNGSSIVLSVKISKTSSTAHCQGCNKIDTVIGGVMIVPPTKEGVWDCPDDETFFDFYRKHGLHEIDSAGFEDIIRYENWESENVLPKVKEMKLRAWHVFFWGIEPKYSGVGYGSASYNDIIKILEDIDRREYCNSANDPSSKLPVIMALSHCNRASSFHLKHGFITKLITPICLGVELTVRDTHRSENPPEVQLMVFNAPESTQTIAE